MAPGEDSLEDEIRGAGNVEEAGTEEGTAVVVVALTEGATGTGAVTVAAAVNIEEEGEGGGGGTKVEELGDTADLAFPNAGAGAGTGTFADNSVEA